MDIHVIFLKRKSHAPLKRVPLSMLRTGEWKLKVEQASASV